MARLQINTTTQARALKESPVIRALFVVVSETETESIVHNLKELSEARAARKGAASGLSAEKNGQKR
jgi:hypothetical protein